MVPKATISFNPENLNPLELRLQAPGRVGAQSNATSIFIWIAAPSKTRTFLNHAWSAFFGCGTEEPPRKGWTELHPDDVEPSLSTYLQSFDARRSFLMEYRMRRADGKYRWMLDKGAPYFTPDGEFAGYVGCAIDRTDWRDAEENNAGKLDGLGMLTLRTLNYFNDLLKCILADTGGALPESNHTSPVHQALERIEDVGNHASGIFRQITLYATREERDRRPADLRRVMEDLLPILRICLPSGSALDIELPPAPLLVNLKTGQLRDLLIQLIVSIADANCGNKGAVTIRARAKRLPRAESLSLAYVSFEVPCALPISSNDAPDERFNDRFSLNSIGNRIQSLGGSMLVDIHPIDGRSIELLLPAASGNSMESRARSSRTEGANATGTVLVVEDELTLRLAISAMLRNRGFSVLQAGSAELALDLIRTEQSIPVVLLDVSLPGKSGREVLEELRQTRPDTKIILTSAYPRESLPFRALDHDGFIQKPYRFEELDGLLRTILPT